MSDHPQTTDAVVVEKSFDAPITLIWQLWTEPDHFKQWYGPHGFTVSVAEMDVRVGGKRLICMEMQAPDGVMQMWTTGAFTHLEPHTRLAYTESPSDTNGNALSPSAAGMPEGFPAVTEVTVVLQEVGNRTQMTLTHAGLPAGSAGAEGYKQAFAKLAEYAAKLAGDR